MSGSGSQTRRLLEQQSEELPFRLPQQRQPRQLQQQHWVSGRLRRASTLRGQNWQVGICRACDEESRPVPAMPIGIQK
ncbi:MAG: hypothetical protein F6K19_05010 [Cyanothece sp. SIO1E1]|nr:hypothetical protein [Cyanothece sp. SIO1E1]